MIFQYPGINSYIVQKELGNTFILPISSILSSVCIFRLFFSFKVFKNITKWSSLSAERICDKYVCEANSSFAFKALQKEYPFITLTVIFILTCICFGFSLRVFELHFWETKEIIIQDWTYEWNAVWCIFVSMTTVGYGDFYPKTHLGRIIVIIACLVGTYFVSMMMVFMTQKSILNDTEFKSYKLVARLRLRKEIKSIQANLVYESLLMNKVKKNIQKYPYESKYKIMYEIKKMIIKKLMNQIKAKDKKIKTFEFLPTKEQLYDLSDRIDTDIKELLNEIESLSLINEEMIRYTDSQIAAIKQVKKSIYETELMYNLIINNKENFGILGTNLSKEVKEEENNLNINSNNKINYNSDSNSKDDFKFISSNEKNNKTNSVFKNSRIENNSENEVLNLISENYKLKKEINFNLDLINGEIIKELFKNVFTKERSKSLNPKSSRNNLKMRSNIRNKSNIFSSPNKRKKSYKYTKRSGNLTIDNTSRASG